MSSFNEMKNNKNYLTATIILAILLLWMASGLITGSDKEKTSALIPSSTHYQVRAKYINAQPYASQLRISAKTEAYRSVSIRAEVDGQVIKLPVKKGNLVKEGDIICELALEDRQLRVEQSIAEVNKAQLEHDAASQLKTSGFQARTVIATKKYELETARANLKRSELNLDKIKIRAPFDGVTDDRPVEIGDLMQKGDICATILDFDPLLIVGQVAGKNINHIKKGSPVTAQLLTGEQVKGTVHFIGSNSDNLTRTFRLEIAVDNKKNQLRSGITAEIFLSTGEIMAHLISPSLLSLDDSGKLGVRIIDEKSQVNFIHVSLLGDDKQGIWVAGLPKQSLLITVGQEYVSEGQTVSSTIENLPQD